MQQNMRAGRKAITDEVGCVRLYMHDIVYIATVASRKEPAMLIGEILLRRALHACIEGCKHFLLHISSQYCRDAIMLRLYCAGIFEAVGVHA